MATFRMFPPVAGLATTAGAVVGAAGGAVAAAAGLGASVGLAGAGAAVAGGVVGCVTGAAVGAAGAGAPQAARRGIVAAVSPDRTKWRRVSERDIMFLPLPHRWDRLAARTELGRRRVPHRGHACK